MKITLKKFSSYLLSSGNTLINPTKTFLSKFSSMHYRVILVTGLAGLLVWTTLSLVPKTVTIRVDNQTIQHKSLCRTVGAALMDAGVPLEPGDVVQPAVTATVTRGMVITVNRAVCVRINADGKSMLVQTPKVPVKSVLQVAGITVGPLDRVNIPLTRVVAAGTVITVNRVTEQIVLESYQVPPPVASIKDPQLESGESRLVRAGMPGEGQRQYRVVAVDGSPASRMLLGTQILRNPVSRLIAIGTLSTVSRGGNDIHFQKAIGVIATAYSYKSGTYTSTGTRVHFGEVAVDPNVIPLGTRLYIEGYGYATAEDTGGAIKGNRVDLFFDSEQQCDSWGRRSTEVYIVN